MPTRMRHAFHTLLIVCACTASISLAGEETKTNWPQFLGPHRNGISEETGLIDKWTGDGPQEVWRVEGGVGMSGMAVVDGVLYTLVQAEGKQSVIALNAKTGKTAWSTPVASAFRNSMGNGPRATPLVRGERVFAFTGDGILAALNLADGKIAWQHDTLRENKGKLADYGMACSPLLVGENVVVTIGAPRATVVAYRAKDGKQMWTANAGEPAGYSSPSLLKIGGREQLAVFAGSAALGLDPNSGATLWKFPFATDYECNIITPLAIDGNAFISAGENQGSVLLSLKRDGDNFQPEVKWESRARDSVLRSEWQTPILHDGHLYGFDNVGSAGPITHLTCVNLKTGKAAWRENRWGKGNMIFADGKLFATTMKGDFVVIEATPEGYRELGRKKVLRGTRQTPALSDGHIYLRDDAEIVCLDVRSSK